MPEPTVAFVDDVFAPLEMVYAEAAGEAAGGAISFEHLDAMAKKFGEERGAELVGMKRVNGVWVENPNAEWVIDKTTRDETNRLLQEAMKEGLSPHEFAQRLEDSGLYSEARAEVIARTEVAIAQNYGQSETYGEMGFSRVYIQDGDCDECREVDGKVASLAWIQNNPVGHPNAIFAGTEVLTLGSVTTGYRAKWSGPAIRITTAMGNVLAVSPNHPVLTGRGWIPAKEVRAGDHTVSNHRRDDGACAGHFDLDKRPAPVEKIFDALASNGAATLCPTAPTHFHGDGNSCQGYVDVVWTDSPLSSEWNAPFLKEGHELIFAPAGVELEPFAGLGAGDLGGEGVPLPAPGRVSLLDVRRIRIARAQDYPALTKATADDQVADADFLRELESRFAVKVSLDEVVEVGDIEFSCHAFDLTTGFGAYFANGILTHNCVRSCSPAPDDEPIELE